MPAGRPPKPSALHTLEGTRNRRKNTEPKFGGTPSCPKHLSKAAKAEWKRMADELAAQGLLTLADRAVFSAYCTAWSRMVDAELNIQKFGTVVKAPSGYPVQNPYVSIFNTASAEMRKCASEFGMTPASRAKIDVTDVPTSGDPFTAFMESIGAAEDLTHDDQTELQPTST